MVIPVACTIMDGLGDLLNSSEITSFKREIFQGFPPWFNQIQPRTISRQEQEANVVVDEVPQADIDGFMHRKIIHNQHHPLSGKGAHNVIQEVNKISLSAGGAGHDMCVTRGGLEGPKDPATTLPSVIRGMVGWFAFRTPTPTLIPPCT